MMIKTVETLLQGGLGEMGVFLLVAVVIMVVLYFVSSFSGGGVGSTSTDEMTDLYFDEDKELKYDFTNEDVQQWLRSKEDGLEQLESWAEDDLARLIYEGENESHYAVLNVWWYEMAKDLGFEEPEADEEYTEFTIAIAFTSAYEVHSDRVGDVPELDDGAIGTSPFLVEHDHQAGATESERLGERTESDLI